MAACLIALGSNLGDRAAHLRSAVGALARVERTRVVKRSAWRETPPVGGPAGQGAYLNGAVQAESALDSRQLFVELTRIEAALGRVRRERWGPRTVDLDLLLYEDEQSCDSQGVLAVPHPRMHFRRFVLEPAAEAAPWMIHPTSGWTVAQLLRQLDVGADHVAIAAEDASQADELVARLNSRRTASDLPAPIVRRWVGGGWDPGPRALLALGPLPGVGATAWRKMLRLPPAGPVAWLGSDSLQRAADEAWSVLTAAWPERPGADSRA